MKAKERVDELYDQFKSLIGRDIVQHSPTSETLMLDSPMSSASNLHPHNENSWVFPKQPLNILFEIFHVCRDFLLDAERTSLIYEEKDYFAFSIGPKRSRAVNRALYLDDNNTIDRFADYLRGKTSILLPSHEISSVCYTIAISFCAFIDLTSSRNQKTPGTFFEYMIGLLISIRLKSRPRTWVEVANVDWRFSLPTDLIFDLGEGKPKFHVPVKTSTRERVVQAWAHQRILDSAFGFGQYLGMLFCLSETKVNSKTLKVDEICLPGQWRVYQLFIAKLKRIYYLDPPSKYLQLEHVFPPVPVKPFGDFFHEIENVIAEPF